MEKRTYEYFPRPQCEPPMHRIQGPDGPRCSEVGSSGSRFSQEEGGGILVSVGCTGSE